MSLVIIDLDSWVKLNSLEIKRYGSSGSVFLALSPCAFYFLEESKVNYIHFHNIVSKEIFRDLLLEVYNTTRLKNKSNSYFDGFFRNIAQKISRNLYLETLVDFIFKGKYTKIVLITDRTRDYEKSIDFTTVIRLKGEKNTLVKKQKLFFKYDFLQMCKKLLYKIRGVNLYYDWQFIAYKVKKKNVVVKRQTIIFNIENQYSKYISDKLVKFEVDTKLIGLTNYFTFLRSEIYLAILEYRKRNKVYFYQHGSYLYKNIFMKYAEVNMADINFVFNDYTKNYFQSLGAKRVYTTGSILFNKMIKEKEKEYDFLYITQGHDYLGDTQYVDFENSLHSFDGYELYQRHKSIIKLFGEGFKDKKIIIRVHPCVVTNGVYVPFWELAESYSNITIDIDIPMHTLIEKSKYIISDYFTTEFINRELHYKRDIILFQGAPTPLPKETIEDMKKMFILIDTVKDLKEKIKNIEDITNNRKRYNDIIEYYSSKKCDTKEEVLNILKKEFYGR